MSRINESAEFWAEQRKLQQEVLAAPKGVKKQQAQTAADAHLQNASAYLSQEIAYWCKSNEITDLSTDEQIIGVIVDWTADHLRTSETQTKRFYEYAEQSGLLDAIAWRADEVAKEFGENQAKTHFVKTVRYLATTTTYAVPFIHAVIAAGDEALRESLADGLSMSTSAGHNLVDAYKREGKRTALRDISSMCDFLRRLAQIW